MVNPQPLSTLEIHKTISILGILVQNPWQIKTLHAFKFGPSTPPAKFHLQTRSTKFYSCLSGASRGGSLLLRFYYPYAINWITPAEVQVRGFFPMLEPTYIFFSSGLKHEDRVNIINFMLYFQGMSFIMLEDGRCFKQQIASDGLQSPCVPG